MDKAKDFEKGWEEYKAKQKQEVENIAKEVYENSQYSKVMSTEIARYIVKNNYRKIPEGSVVIDKNENPCLSCPVPEDIQRNVDCSTICGSVRLGIDWQNQCKVLVKENKRVRKECTQVRKETVEKIMNDISGDVLIVDTKEYGKIEVVPFERLDEICKEFTEGKNG